MNFGDIGGIGWVVESYLATPEGKETIESILPHVLGALNLPPGAADTITAALGSKQ